ncbi:unnamed protein product [Arctogadus glacialis]
MTLVQKVSGGCLDPKCPMQEGRLASDIWDPNQEPPPVAPSRAVETCASLVDGRCSLWMKACCPAELRRTSPGRRREQHNAARSGES